MPSQGSTEQPFAPPSSASPAPAPTSPARDSPPSRDLASPRRIFWIALPYAIYIGFTTNGAVSLLLRQAGMPVEGIANAIALLGIPSSIYFLWSPLLDLWMRRRSWYVLAALGSAAALALGSFLLPTRPGLAVWVYFAGLCLCMMLSSAYGGLIASMLTPASRTRAAAWTQASNLGGGAVGPGLILYLALHLRPALWVPSAALITALPALAVWALAEPARPETIGLHAHLRSVVRELRATCLSPRNSFGLFLLLAPPGAGALTGLLPALSPDYGVSGDAVVWINGFGGGLIMALGCLAGGWVPARLDRRIAYACSGAVVSIPALYLALAPGRASAYLGGTIAYLFALGVTSTLSMDLVLDTVGAVGRSGSLRYSTLTALAYTPVAYMTWIEGRAAHAFGWRGVPAAEALSCLFDLPFVMAWWLWIRRNPPAAPPPGPRTAGDC